MSSFEQACLAADEKKAAERKKAKANGGDEGQFCSSTKESCQPLRRNCGTFSPLRGCCLTVESPFALPRRQTADCLRPFL